MRSVNTIEPVRVAVTVAVSPERAWDVFTTELPNWWPARTHSVAAGEDAVPDRIVVEPGVGGEIYELTGAVRRHWARFESWEPPHRLSYTWAVNPEKPATDVVVTFTPVAEGTRVEVVHSGWEAYAESGPEWRANYGAQEGWPTVMAAYAAAAGEQIPPGMPEDGWLSKSEVNSLYYNTVAGEIAFATEASIGFHPGAVARLVAHHAADRGLRQIRVLEIGANDCGFAREFIDEIGTAQSLGKAEIDRLDYLAVEFARPSLEAVAAWAERSGYFERVMRAPAGSSAPGEPPPKPTIVALAVIDAELNVNLGLVHAEANQFIRANTEPIDFVILNELLDDMPCRAYFADDEARRFEAVPGCQGDDGRWTVRVEAVDPGDADLDGIAPETITARSADWVELVSGAAATLRAGGMLLVHDYGFAEQFTSLVKYEEPPATMPAFATMSYPDGAGTAFPRSFFRVFGNEQKAVVQVTNDVNFAELAAALAALGSVFSIPHGVALLHAGKELAKGDGVFLAEFGRLEQDDDLPAVLARLHADQVQYRDDYASTYTGGRGNVFLDLVFVKS